MGNVCPRCDRDNMKEPIGENAISSEDGKTWICSDCGINESRLSFFQFKGEKHMIPERQLELKKKFREILGLD